MKLNSCMEFKKKSNGWLNVESCVRLGNRWIKKWTYSTLHHTSCRQNGNANTLSGHSMYGQQQSV